MSAKPAMRCDAVEQFRDMILPFAPDAPAIRRYTPTPAPVAAVPKPAQVDPVQHFGHLPARVAVVAQLRIGTVQGGYQVSQVIASQHRPFPLVQSLCKNNRFESDLFPVVSFRPCSPPGSRRRINPCGFPPLSNGAIHVNATPTP